MGDRYIAGLFAFLPLTLYTHLKPNGCISCNKRITRDYHFNAASFSSCFILLKSS